jgi:MFS transporter, ACS family, hexuronate transporter
MSEVAAKMSRVRWTICTLLFFATTVNYVDRQLYSILVPFFENDLRLGPTDLALINVSFLLAYGFGMIFVGRFIDRVGTRFGLSASFLLWNVASIGHALITSLTGFMGIRFLLGLGEAGNFPAAIKTVAEWFPKKERAYATGWFNSGSNIGAVLASLLGVALAQEVGWRNCFLILGGVGSVWIFFWLRIYRSPELHPKVSAEELAHIQSDPPDEPEPVTYGQLFRMRPVWAIAVASFFTDAPWWFYLTWLPKFLVDGYKLDPKFMGIAVPIVFVAADLGSIGGGWISSRLISMGRSIGSARKTAMLICALCAVPVSLVGAMVDIPSILGIPTIYFALVIMSLAASAHQGWSCNLFTLISDTLPRKAVAMTVGIKTAFAVVGSAFFQLFVGRAVQLTGSYLFPFMLAGSLYLVGLLAVHLIMPVVEPTRPGKAVSLVAVVGVGLALLAGLVGTQAILNKPPYLSLSDYMTLRRTELKSDSAPVEGPSAKVGWMTARWYLWRPVGKPAKLELVKFDRSERPIVEGKGTAAAQYKGPTKDDLAKTFPVTP